MTSQSKLPRGAAVGLWVWLSVSTAVACPFCTAISETYREQLASMDVVVVAKSQAPSEAGAAAARKEKFEVTEILKGPQWITKGSAVETIVFGDLGDDKKQFLIMGVDPPKTAWSAPMPLTDRMVRYLRQLPDLPEDEVEQLAFFMEYLEDEEESLATDAYGEFARAPYDVVKKLKPRMDRRKLIEWIRDPAVPTTRRRLYLTMLGVCGSRNDLPMLEQLLRSDDRTYKSGLDALVACYLTLAGPDGMGLVEELFLKDPEAEYTDTYAAIMALRFHGSETDVIPRKRILEALHHVLDRPQLADLVIPDLARWEDWSVMPRLVQLFKEADEKTAWLRVPVVNYLRACPRPEAQQYLKELEKIDPGAVQRASTFFPFGGRGAGRN